MATRTSTPQESKAEVISIGSLHNATEMWRRSVCEFRAGISAGRHWRHFHCYDDCFTASSAVNWLQNFLCKHLGIPAELGRQRALLLLRKFVFAGVIAPVGSAFHTNSRNLSPSRFKDNKDLYRLTQSGTPGRSIMRLVGSDIHAVTERKRGSKSSTAAVTQNNTSPNLRKFISSSMRTKKCEKEVHYSRPPFLSKPSQSHPDHRPMIQSDSVEVSETSAAVLKSLSSLLSDSLFGDRLNSFFVPQWVYENTRFHHDDCLPSVSSVNTIPAIVQCSIDFIDKCFDLSSDAISLRKDVFKVVEGYFERLSEPLIPFQFGQYLLFVFRIWLDNLHCFSKPSYTPNQNGVRKCERGELFKAVPGHQLPSLISLHASCPNQVCSSFFDNEDGLLDPHASTPQDKTLVGQSDMTSTYIHSTHSDTGAQSIEQQSSTNTLINHEVCKGLERVHLFEAQNFLKPRPAVNFSLCGAPKLPRPSSFLRAIENGSCDESRNVSVISRSNSSAFTASKSVPNCDLLRKRLCFPVRPSSVRLQPLSEEFMSVKTSIFSQNGQERFPDAKKWNAPASSGTVDSAVGSSLDMSSSSSESFLSRRLAKDDDLPSLPRYTRPISSSDLKIRSDSVQSLPLKLRSKCVTLSRQASVCSSLKAFRSFRKFDSRFSVKNKFSGGGSMTLKKLKNRKRLRIQGRMASESTPSSAKKSSPCHASVTRSSSLVFGKRLFSNALVSLRFQKKPISKSIDQIHDNRLPLPNFDSKLVSSMRSNASSRCDVAEVVSSDSVIPARIPANAQMPRKVVVPKRQFHAGSNQRLNCFSDDTKTSRQVDTFRLLLTLLSPSAYQKLSQLLRTLSSLSRLDSSVEFRLETLVSTFIPHVFGDLNMAEVTDKHTAEHFLSFLILNYVALFKRSHSSSR